MHVAVILNGYMGRQRAELAARPKDVPLDLAVVH